VGHALSLGGALCVLWLALSGMFQGMLLTFGLASCVFVVFLALRMDVVDHEGHPVHLRFGLWLRYIGWLAIEIVKANVDVVRRIVSPDLPISPTIVRLPCTQHTDFGRVMYANSITLTPGTVTIDLDDECVTVHALTREGAEALASGEMDARVTALEEWP